MDIGLFCVIRNNLWRILKPLNINMLSFSLSFFIFLQVFLSKHCPFSLYIVRFFFFPAEHLSRINANLKALTGFSSRNYKAKIFFLFLRLNYYLLISNCTHFLKNNFVKYFQWIFTPLVSRDSRKRSSDSSFYTNFFRYFELMFSFNFNVEFRIQRNFGKILRIYSGEVSGA